MRASTDERLDGPNWIAFDAEGKVWIASQLTNRVLRFGPGEVREGEFIGGGLSSPMGFAIFGPEVFVTGGASDSVSVLDLAGQLVRRIDTDPPIRGPQGIAFDELGRFVTASFCTGAVARFESSGASVVTFSEADIRTARSVAFEPLDAPMEAEFIRGDFHRDDRVDVSDPVAVLGFLFLGTESTGCEDAGDAADDGALSISDAILVLSRLFSGGAPPPVPFPEPGLDPSPDR